MPSIPCLPLDEFNQFGKAFDLKVLEAARPLWCNLVHIHGENILFDQVCDYPVQIFNWHDQSTPPSLKQGLALCERRCLWWIEAVADTGPG